MPTTIDEFMPNTSLKVAPFGRWNGAKARRLLP
jgi:hypothetical protein